MLADLAVREAFGGEVSDLEFLRGQLVAGGGGRAAGSTPLMRAARGVPVR